jgi:hypothetical protein
VDDIFSHARNAHSVGDTGDRAGPEEFVKALANPVLAKRLCDSGGFNSLCMWMSAL